MSMHYLDWNATAPLSAAARAAWLAAYDAAWANPGSIHAAGQTARHYADQAKATCARLLGCKPHELVVTSGGTEANALAITSTMIDQAVGPRSVLVTATDHSSILRTGERYGATRLPVDNCGRLSPETIEKHADESTRLVCIQFANNETGVRQDVTAIVEAVRRVAPSARVLLDCAQGAGKAPIDFHALGVDFASVAGHKIGSPRGIGLLYARNGVRVTPMLNGGRQQQDRRSGTEDVAGLAALAAAMDDALAHGEEERERQRDLLEGAFIRIAALLPDVQWLAQPAKRMSNTMSLLHPKVSNKALITRLDLAGIAVSAGSACMAVRGDPSHVVSAMGVAPDLAQSVIRVSIGPGTTADNVDAFVTTYVAEVKQLIG